MLLRLWLLLLLLWLLLLMMLLIIQMGGRVGLALLMKHMVAKLAGLLLL